MVLSRNFYCHRYLFLHVWHLKKIWKGCTQKVRLSVFDRTKTCVLFLFVLHPSFIFIHNPPYFSCHLTLNKKYSKHVNQNYCNYNYFSTLSINLVYLVTLQSSDLKKFWMVRQKYWQGKYNGKIQKNWHLYTAWSGNPQSLAVFTQIQ